jgi:hypothetical protein
MPHADAIRASAVAGHHCRESLSDADRDRIIAGLARFTGIPPAAIDHSSTPL